ncbi:hypothetical protein C5708_06735 [Caulobacter sp. CCUG 60055]|uniref:hypothetical protein n=1 Tax=Caulobacter sp. CCUG 60055 TaxID=2100090 RepID=UPI001FA801E2|nr:hypothetical protein [Caulobacter sp. CCUG 60055]MBQ1543153.1 hypothetical protein [Caulobacteraceae bacterium]MCI3179947.1 hypothetical protein [Caulobacter sp. CCUG 60055]
MTPLGYYEAMGWWFWMGADMPAKSIFPDDGGGPGWAEGEIPGEFRDTKHDVQGWKLHVCVQPGEIEGLFVALSPLLKTVAHKFAPVDTYNKQSAGYAAYQLISPGHGDGAAGKACVIYPNTPVELAGLVLQIDQAIRNLNAVLTRPIRGRTSPGVRPFPGGVKGDLALGSTGFVYTRYGAFSGKLADQNKVYDPIAKQACPDPRFVKPHPDFIKAIPAEIDAVRRR